MLDRTLWSESEVQPLHLCVWVSIFICQSIWNNKYNTQNRAEENTSCKRNRERKRKKKTVTRCKHKLIGFGGYKTSWLSIEQTICLRPGWTAIDDNLGSLILKEKWNVVMPLTLTALTSLFKSNFITKFSYRLSILNSWHLITITTRIICSTTKINTLT